ncbi:MAG: hypothetical protein ACI9C4_001084 [Paraglaciecola sp.]|jgi:hypothetical protein
MGTGDPVVMNAGKVVSKRRELALVLLDVSFTRDKISTHA